MHWYETNSQRLTLSSPLWFFVHIQVYLHEHGYLYSYDNTRIRVHRIKNNGPRLGPSSRLWYIYQVLLAVPGIRVAMFYRFISYTPGTYIRVYTRECTLGGFALVALQFPIKDRKRLACGF